MKVLAEIDAFFPPELGSYPVMRRWFRRDGWAIYIRLNHRNVGGATVPTFELCDVTLAEDRRGCGQFSELFASLEGLACRRGMRLLVENVISDQVRAMLERRGFIEYSHNTFISP